jgi:DNA-binding response OmpR family regulator
MARPTDRIANLLEELAEARETIRQLREGLTVSTAPRYRGLSASVAERAIIEALLRAPGLMHRDTLNDLLDITLHRIDAVDPKVINVQVCRLRRKLAALVPPIEIQTAWGDGYYMTDENKERIRDIRWPVDPL